ncbi:MULTISPECIES: DUF4127 family protein [unclassified Streptomyces]|uniref:DUF4127 family protein n=1 Tax=unclassified Streptomyces TaxID=2593676 RepID=UPI0035D56627
MTDDDTLPTIALIPLDERPACAALPAAVARVAGVRAVLPPAAILPQGRTPGDADETSRWLAESARTSFAAVVSLETLGHGGLIASRTRGTTVAEVTARWNGLRGIARAGVPVHAVTLVTRTPDSADATEEPDYWDPHGPALHRWSARLHQGAGQEVRAPDSVPEAVRADFLRRRLRNHALNLAALELLTDGTLESLVIGADDTAPHALATAELTWLGQWTGWLDGGHRTAIRPGADEACTTLVARCVTRHLGGPPPRVALEALTAEGLARTAPYENVSVAETAHGQISTCGARLAAPDETADIHLLVHTPDDAGDWAIAPPVAREEDHAARDRAEALADRVACLLADGRTVAVADCAQPNGADPLLVHSLASRGVLEQLTGYAAWNTAGNTLGTAVAHAVTAVTARRAGTFDEQAHQRLLLHRLLEDWAYMSRVRAALRIRCGSDPARHDHVPDGDALIAFAEGLLRDCRAELPAFGGLDITPGSVRLPWQRTFEVDFALSYGPADRTAEED